MAVAPQKPRWIDQLIHLLLSMFQKADATYIAANHSDFGGILPIFKQYFAIPIGMTVFRQNLKKLCCITVKTRLKIARRFILLNMYCASVASCIYCLGDTAACNGICDWLVGVLLPNE